LLNDILTTVITIRHLRLVESLLQKITLLRYSMQTTRQVQYLSF